MSIAKEVVFIFTEDSFNSLDCKHQISNEINIAF